MTLQAVFFDLDGTLINSEPEWLAVEHEIMDWLEGPWDVEHQDQVVGGSLWRTVDYMLGLATRPQPRELVAERLLTLMAARLSTGVVLMPGAKELLVEVSASGVPVALVTSTVRQLADAAIDAIGRDLFKVTVCGDEVEHTKPHPEPYLKAARLLGVDPAACVVLEDSPTGVAAGEAAGCAVIAVPGIVAIPEAPTRTVVPTLEGLSLDGLRELLGGGSVLP
ncbi:HAD family phosphatase [Actinocorallia longicatena]|uniref:HAD family phosphatase n=1 Tax=Actinocorallia longicatena TaxID=111803 RepID=A0ABP6Q710_9ACTN